MKHVLSDGQLAAESRAEELRNITDTANDAIITINENSEILSWNAAATRIFGHAAEDAVGQQIHLIIPEHFREAHDNGVAGIGRVPGRGVGVVGASVSCG